MKWINAEEQVIVTIYDEEHEEHLVKIMTVEEMLDAYTNDGCPTIYSNPERKKGEWILKKDAAGNRYGRCSKCGMIQYAGQLNYCPNCGTSMVRGEEE